MPMRDEQALWCVEWGKRATEGRTYPDGFSLHKSLDDAEEYQKVNLQCTCRSEPVCEIYVRPTGGRV